MKDELKKLNAELENLNDQLATAESDLFIVQEYTRQYINGETSLFKYFEEYDCLDAIPDDAPLKSDWEELYDEDINKVIEAYPNDFDSRDDYAAWSAFCENSNEEELDGLKGKIKEKIDEIKEKIYNIEKQIEAIEV